MKVKKFRLDELLVKLGLVPTRSKSQALILAGQVLINGQVCSKCSDKFQGNTAVGISPGSTLKYVSRGGLKLEGAVKTLKVQVAGKIAVDVGSSTGGFTDCLLQNGAKIVYAVDVGKGLLDAKLRKDPRVRLMEKTNARFLKRELFDPKPELATIDVSFISLEIILPAVVECLEKPPSPHPSPLEGEGRVRGSLKLSTNLSPRILALVKPQFEVGKGQTKGGVVKNEALRMAAIAKIRDFAQKKLGLTLLGECPSPVPGPEGNIEHFLYLAS
ncbi:MAG: TlyA family RNA methyltransferase [Elusimicrobia bacterium]|nr:TlyA family RNA methyltransferase [Elusimicrobiota bacterium]